MSELLISHAHFSIFHFFLCTSQFSPCFISLKKLNDWFQFAYVFLSIVVSVDQLIGNGLMIWFLIVGLKSITYILKWNKKKNARRKAFTAHLTACQAADEAERRVA